jgi:hypothetical protein
MDLSKSEEMIIASIKEHITSKSEKEKQNAICDIALFKAMLMEEVYCNTAAFCRKELSKLRVMEANEPSDLPRAVARKNKEVLLKEAIKLKESASEFDSKKMRLITKVFESINGECAIEAKAMCVDYVIGAIELFMKHTSEAGTVVCPAISVKEKVLAFPELLNRDDYRYCQGVGARIHHEGHPGLITRSARYLRGDTIAILNSKVLSSPRHAAYFSYTLQDDCIDVREDGKNAFLTIPI